MKHLRSLCLSVLIFGVSGLAKTNFAHAEDESVASGTTAGSVSTVTHRWGGYVGLGNPYPTLLGLNAAYNFDPHIRATAGYGEVEVTSSFSYQGGEFVAEKIKAQTYALGADYLFRDSGLRPLIGAKVGYFSVTGKGEFTIQGINKSTGLVYSNLGIDYLTDSGWNFGTGLNVALVGGKGANFYANVGRFF